MKILYITDNLPPHGGWGGIGTYVSICAQYLSSLGHEVMVLCPPVQGRPYEDHQFGYKVFRGIIGNDWDSKSSAVLDVYRKLVEKGSLPDVVEAPEYGALALKIQNYYPRAKVVVRIHGGTLMCYLASKNGIARILRQLIFPNNVKIQHEREIDSLKKAHAVSAPTAWAYEETIKLGLPKVNNFRKIRNPVDLPKDAIQIFGERTNNNETAADVIFFGRLDPIKGVWLLPAIINGIVTKRPNTVLKVIGQDQAIKGKLQSFLRGASYRQYVEGRLNPRAAMQSIFINGIPHSEIGKYLQRSSIAVFMSTTEVMGYTHVEAMMNGMACVIASGGGARELGEPSVHYVASNREDDEIVSHVVELIDNEKLRHSIADAAFSYSAAKYSIDVVGCELIALYESVSVFSIQ